MRIAGATEGYERVFVTQESGPSGRLEAQGERVELLPTYDRHPLRGRLLVTLARSARLAWRDRPDVVVTTGTGLVVPFCVFSWLLGARVVFVETAARIRQPSMSGRLLSRLAVATLVQWPEMLRVYPRARLCRPSVVDAVGRRGTEAVGQGTFVGVGTHRYPFYRLLNEVSRAVEAGVLPGPVVAQTGVASEIPPGVDASPWMTPEQIDQGIRGAQYVVCHAGSGLISTALSHGRRPIVMARQTDLGEHYDDHQVETVKELERLGLVVRADQAIDASVVHAVNATPLPEPERGAPPPVVEGLREVLTEDEVWRSSRNLRFARQ